jgi:integrase
VVPKKDKRTKPKKPRRDWPLSAHSCGQWVKVVTVNGKQKTHYLGPWDKPEEALAEWVRIRDHALLGQSPPANIKTVADLLDEFLGAKKAELDLGELSEEHWSELVRVTDAIANHFGTKRPLETLSLSGLRTSLANGKNGKELGPKTFSRRLTIARSVFRFGGIHAKQELKPPPQKALRQAKREAGEKLYSNPADVRKLVKTAERDVKAFVLLGISAAFGPADCCEVPRSAFTDELVKFPRPKTGVERSAWRWPELTDSLLPPWRENWDRFKVARAFADLCKAAGVTNHGFYSLRRTVETVVSAGPVSQHVINQVMGHDDKSMAAVYRQRTHGIKAAGEWLRGWYLGKNQLER